MSLEDSIINNNHLFSSQDKVLTISQQFWSPPGKLNLTLLLFLISLVLVSLSTIGYWLWAWENWYCFLINIIALHIAGTVIHDASHHVAHPNRLINAILGHVSAFMLCLSFPVFLRVHMQHHAHVNEKENDPDHFVCAGGPLILIPFRFLYHEFFFFQRRLWRKHELWEWLLSRLFLITCVYFAIESGYLFYIIDFWFLPALFIGLEIGFFFGYLPHYPFIERERWKNTVVYPSPILNILIMGQNYHLIHHLWPSICWYDYQNMYYAKKYLLDIKGCKQSLELLETKTFFRVIHDLFIGIH
ncbi:fatty acid desaturase [Nostoc sp. NIES-4103]|nr:fatty acid desaturase [Nostoc sp. NIES-4103]